MPFYSYHCDACDLDFDRMLPMSRFDEPQTCDTCSGVAKKVVVAVGVIFKGDDWASKNNRVAGQMREKNARLGKKQDERKRDAPGVTLAPNVNGERVGSWAEAQSLAKSLGKDTASYEPKIRAEQSAKK
jgi:putative FmdB family regulatory protein